MANTNHPQYNIYKIHFKIDIEKSVQNHDKDANTYLKNAEQCMLSLFDLKTIKGLYQYHEKKDNVIYPNDVMCPIRWDVIWWRVNNVQKKKYVKHLGEDSSGRGKYEDDEINSYPYTNVIVDLRKDYCQLAIQKTSAWPNTDNLKDIIQESFHRLLSDKYGLDIEIEPKMEPTKFWSFVNRQIYDYGDYIRKVTFSLKNPKRVKGINKSEIKSARLKSMARVAEISDAIKSFFTLEFDCNSDKKKFSERNRDVAEMVNLCSSNGFDLTVHFKNFKLYRIDERVKACYLLPDDYLMSFSHNSVNTNNTLDLIDWLDDVHNKTQNSDASQTPTKRNT